MDGSTEQPQITAGLDLGDKYSYLCLLDTSSGEVVEEGLLCALYPRSPQAALLLGAAATTTTAHSAIEAGTHSPWVSRVLEQECGHEVLVANARKVRLTSTPTQAQNR
jgi:hypothetical protein